MSISFRIEVAQDRVIRGELFPAEYHPQGTLIICHGFKGFKDWGFFPHVAETLSSSLSLNVITFNFSHNGVGDNPLEFTELEKFAKNTYTRELEDLDTIVKAIRSNTLPLEDQGERVEMMPEPLYLLGHSRGGGVSLIYAFDHPELVSGVISWNGITNVDLFTEEQKQEMKQNGRTYIVNARTGQHMPLDREIIEDIEANQQRFNIVERAKTATVPIFLIQGTDDHPRLIEGSKRLVNASPQVQWVKIEDGNHTFNAIHPFAGETKPLYEAIKHTEEAIKSILQRS
ncbi:pimeloyl-ACP methyl ester carboxylesterase [Caldalkalibacillus uzonensis]|uniref:Pimeloyl-ACP methyl ester carboxylesterase n=1 Tax=Caldalkalibacillus uzonensis TaxID=353224 RepID=A0ABU0CS46_9BACI|nr:alpha/beta fold hydrolase [Caldalkalibacillus uzonensis]MDQ0338913.1 pimeloyl-ACP methyl ester carboxylesterase [Caldalkalibacillus uzonensis]